MLLVQEYHQVVPFVQSLFFINLIMEGDWDDRMCFHTGSPSSLFMIITVFKHATFLIRGQQAEVNISHARIVVSPRFLNKSSQHNGVKILSNVNVVVCRQVKRKKSLLPVAAHVSKTSRA